MRRIGVEQARRYAVAAQGLNYPKPDGRVDVRHFRRVLSRVGLIQLDSVNVFSRAHYMPFFSRLGPYDRRSLDQWLWRSGEMFEYWGHEASLIPADQHRLFRWRMDGGWHWGRVERLREEQPDYMDEVLRQVDERGPLQTRELEAPGERDPDSMWGWSNGKVALEALFLEGRITASDRPNFTRMYDLTDRVIPREHLDAPDVPREEAQATLLSNAARALGVATADDLGDYYRIRMPQARPLIADLVSKGDLIEIEVAGWGKSAYMHPDAILPRRIEGRCLLSPFDSLIWHRPRVERLWDFHYRIEIYVPESKREYGYYVLPFLLDGVLAARVDLKTDRNKGILRIRGAWSEPGADPRRVAAELAGELEAIAVWLGAEGVEVMDNGDLASPLRRLVQ